LFHPFTTSEESQLRNHESLYDAYKTYESLINDVHLKFIYKILKDVHGLENWEDLELHAHEFTQINNDNIWMNKFDSVNEKFLPNLSLIAQKLNITILDVNSTLKHNVHY
jgi:hypothetical protein